MSRAGARIRPWLACSVWVCVVMLLGAAGAHAQVLVNARTGRPFPCPDPSAVDYGDATYMACTTDLEPNMFALWESTDPAREFWQPDGYVFPAGTRPAWATPGGAAWAPDLTRIGDQWVVYFAMAAPEWGSPDSMVIGVATSPNLAGPWASHIVHYLGQFPGTLENYDEVIDPGEARDPYTGQRYLVWSEQPDAIWIAPLTPDGMSIQGATIHRILDAEGDPADCEPGHGCFAEGSSLLFHDRRAYLFYSVRNAWDRSYAMRSAYASDPMGAWTIEPGYMLQAGGSDGPGGGQTPVMVEGRPMLFYHALARPDPGYVSDLRMAVGDWLTWHDGRPLVGDGYSPSLSSYPHERGAPTDLRAS